LDCSALREIHPNVLGVTGPHAYDEVLQQVHEHLPKPKHNPFISLVPDHGIKLTPKHFAYLKISEGCNHRCTFCIIPSMRGDLDSRPIGDILSEAKRLVNAGHQVELSPSEFSSTGVCYTLNQWLNEKLHDFGFFRPYKTYNQGVSEEPWHISHVAVSDKIYQQYPYDCYREFLTKSEIKSKEFICGQLEHYKEQYFCNFCNN